MILGGGGWGGVVGKVGVGVFNLSPKVESFFTDLKKYFYETRNWDIFFTIFTGNNLCAFA